MNIQDEHFSRLRGLLAQERSKDTFQQILDTFEDWKEDSQLGLEYALEHLESWPDAYREATLKQYWPDFPNLQPTEHSALVRSLNLFDIQTAQKITCVSFNSLFFDRS